MLPTVASLLPKAPRRQRETELRRERRLAQLQMVDLWRLLYKCGHTQTENSIDEYCLEKVRRGHSLTRATEQVFRGRTRRRAR